MGASRWLDANKPVGTSMSSAMATIAFSRFIKFFLLGIGIVDVVHRGLAVGARRRAPISYDRLRLQSQVRARAQIGFLPPNESRLPGQYCFRVWCGASGPHLPSSVYSCYVFRGRSSVSVIRHCL